MPYFPLSRISAGPLLHLVEITGIPNVDFGVLMVYNLTQPSIFKQENSIYNHDLALSYLEKNIKNYPLNLKVALPAFSWGVHFQYNKIKRLINNTILEDYSLENFEFIKPNLFKSKKISYINNIPINKRDIIRYESPNIIDLKKMITYLKKNINQDSIEFIFFNLESPFLHKNNKEYEKIILDYN